MRSLRAASRESLIVAMKTQHSQKKKTTTTRVTLFKTKRCREENSERALQEEGTANAQVLRQELFRAWSVISSSKKLMESLSVFAGGQGELH